MKPNPHLWECRWVRDLCALLIVALLLAAAYSVRAIVAPVLVGLVLAYVFNPLVTWAETRCKVPRWLSTAMLLLLCATAVVGVLLFVVPTLVQQITVLFESVQGYAATIAGWLKVDWEEAKKIATESLDADDGPAAPLGDVDLRSLGLLVVGVLGFGLDVINSTINLTFYIGLVVVVVAFCFFNFSWKFQSIVSWFGSFIPVAARDETVNLLGRMDRTVSAFVRGRLIQSVVMGLILSAGWWWFEVPYWLLLGMLAGMLNLAPFAASIGALAAVTLAAVDHATTIGAANDAADKAQLLAAMAAQGLDHIKQLTDQQANDALSLAVHEHFRFTVVLWPMVVFLVAQVLDGWAVEPLVQGKATDLDPLTVLLAVLIGGALAGLIGLIIGLPVTACVKILSEQVILPRLRAAAQSPRAP